MAEQASLKHSELEAHPVCNQIKLLLRTLDQHAQAMQDNNVKNVYVKKFIDYINRLVAVVLRSLNPELGKKLQTLSEKKLHSFFKMHFAKFLLLGFLITTFSGFLIFVLIINIACKSVSSLKEKVFLILYFGKEKLFQVFSQDSAIFLYWEAKKCISEKPNLLKIFFLKPLNCSLPFYV